MIYNIFYEMNHIILIIFIIDKTIYYNSIFLLCYRNRISRHYLRLNHLEEWPGIVVVQILD